jgi:hypothetical protein
MESKLSPKQAVTSIRSALSRDLLNDEYRAIQDAGGHRMAGHCFVASEALWHLMGGKGSGFVPHVGRVDGKTHWWVVGPDGTVWDPTFDQFAEPVDYSNGHGSGFGVPGGGPSKRARELLRRVMPCDDVVALFVRADGPYPRMCKEWYDENRDALTYTGDTPVVAHPPCSRWSRFGKGDGDDGGLFAFALETIHRCGGVIEHPAHSLAWSRFSLPAPRSGEWSSSLFSPGLWATEVSQRNYGHRAKKQTWLCVSSDSRPTDIDWSRPAPAEVWSSWTSKRYMRDNPEAKPKMMRRERETTPDPFARLLIGLARQSRSGSKSSLLGDCETAEVVDHDSVNE